MKKILSAVLVVLMIASMASVAAFAADAPTLTVSSAEVAVGTTEVKVDIILSNNPGEVTSVAFDLDYPEGVAPVLSEDTDAASGLHYLSTSAEGALFSSLPVWSLEGTKPVKFIGAEALKAVKDDGLVASINFSIPADAKVGDTFEITIAADKANCTDGQSEEIEFATVNGIITVVEATSETESSATETSATDTSATDTSATDTSATDTSASDTESTKAPDAPVAPPTGDMVFVVLAVMVVALGAAIVVKKVNVK